MSLFRLYARVLSLLGNDKRLAIGLGFANVALAVAAFAEPLIMGRIIDGLTHLKRGGNGLQTMLPLIAAWVAFGFFTIAAGVAIALHADRLAHRNRLSTMANYFEHVLDLPLAFHSANHSGRVLKAMLEGTNGMSALWLGFFRDHFAALVSLGVLLPLWISVLVRAFAWVTLLRRQGLVNQGLQGLGVIDEPLALVWNEFGIVVGMVHYMVPYAVLPMLAAMREIDPRLLAAARGLGASRLTAFARVFLPLSAPGLVAAGVDVPQTVSVCGFDDIPAAAHRSLTTVRQPITERGREIGRMLLDPDEPPRQVMMPVELVVRRSSGPARGPD
jgi:ABC-type spermidine/putrescine transport system permease subunit I